MLEDEAALEDIVKLVRELGRSKLVFAEGIWSKHPFLLTTPDWLAMTSLTHIISQQPTSAADTDFKISHHGRILWRLITQSFGDDY